jgi:hypothetical protein
MNRCVAEETPGIPAGLKNQRRFRSVDSLTTRKRIIRIPGSQYPEEGLRTGRALL